MESFFSDLINFPFLIYALIAAILSSIACGIIGTYVVIQKNTFLAGGIAHCILAGIGITNYLNVIFHFNIPIILGAIIIGVISALIIGYINLKNYYYNDTIISAFWSIGMAIGIIFINKTPGYQINPMNYLFGNILMLNKYDLLFMLFIDFVIISVNILFYQHFVLICFDKEFALIKKIPVYFYYFLLLILTTLTIITLIKTVGLVLVIALISMPQALMQRYSFSVKQMIFTSILLCALLTTSGIIASYYLNLSSGPTIVLFIALVFLILPYFRTLFKTLFRTLFN